jgi:hypothetical protein
MFTYPLLHYAKASFDFIGQPFSHFQLLSNYLTTECATKLTTYQSSQQLLTQLSTKLTIRNPPNNSLTTY